MYRLLGVEDLAGEIEEDVPLDAGLKEYVDAFTKNRSLYGRQQEVIPECAQNVTEGITRRQSSLSLTARTAINELILTSEIDVRERILGELTRDHICLDYALKHDEIRADLFGLRRKLEDPATKQKYFVPLFARVPFGSGEEASSEWVYEDSIRQGYTQTNIKVSSNVPPITRTAREMAKQAEIDFMEAYTKVLRQPVLGDWVNRSHASNPSFPSFGLDIYWIPSSEDLRLEVEIVDKDPMIVADIEGRKFLVTTWDVMGELPYQHYLEEFKIP